MIYKRRNKLARCASCNGLFYIVQGSIGRGQGFWKGKVLKELCRVRFSWTTSIGEILCKHSILVLCLLHSISLKPEEMQLWHVTSGLFWTSETRVQPDPDKIVVVQQWPRPKNFKELISFLGLSGYYRRLWIWQNCSIFN